MVGTNTESEVLERVRSESSILSCSNLMDSRVLRVKKAGSLEGEALGAK
jgi:hypothetical protein